jgi:hypothetical protein
MMNKDTQKENSASKLIQAIGAIDEQLISEYDTASDIASDTTNNTTGNIASKSPAKATKVAVRSSHRARRIGRYSAIAAACLVVVAVGLIAASGLGLLKLPIGGGAQSGGGGALIAGDENEETARTYMFYDGPIFPLTILSTKSELNNSIDNNDKLSTSQINAIEASRAITYDFLPYTDITEEYETDTIDGPTIKKYTSHRTEAVVTDRYTLQNNSNADITVEAAYPVAASLKDLFELTPKLKVDGQQIEPEITTGQYSGGFMGAWSSDTSTTTANSQDQQNDQNDQDGQNQQNQQNSQDQQNVQDQQPQLNLREIDSWLGYKQLLQDGSYLREAFAGVKYANQPAIVYEFDEFVIESGEGVNPSIAVSYTAQEGVDVLSVGFHGGEYPGGDSFIKGFSIPDEQRKQVADDRYLLIVVGGDISDISYQGYSNMGWDDGTEMEISATMTRTETTLEEIFREMLNHHYSIYDSYNNPISDENVESTSDNPNESTDSAQQITKDEQLQLIFEAAYDYLHSYGPLSERNIDRYTEGMLEDIFTEAVNVDRVVYLTSEVNIPAGGSAEIEITQTQRGSHDFFDTGKSYKNAKGYDLTTSLGSNLSFTSQQASIADHDLIKIVDQNFGFDLDQGINTVQLKPEVQYYYMLIEKLKTDD